MDYQMFVYEVHNLYETYECSMADDCCDAK